MTTTSQGIPWRCQVCTIGAASLPEVCPFRESRRAAGSELLTEGEVPPTVWYLRRGRAVYGSLTEAGMLGACGVRGSESLLGLESLLGEPMPHNVWALTDVVLCSVDVAAFKAWMGRLGSTMGAVLHLALRESSRRVADRQALEGTAVQRIARFLITSHRASGPDDPLELQQRVVARVLGMRPETLSRALARLREAKAVAKGRSLRIANLEALERFADL